MTGSIPADDRIEVPGTPAIPGLAFRRFRGEADYALMCELLDETSDADNVEYVNTVDDIAQVFANLTNCDPYRDMLFAEVGGQLAAFSRVWWREADTGEWLYRTLGFVRPAWRRKGLGTAMLRYNEARLCDIARDHPKEAPRFYEVWASDGETGAHALFARAGYQPERLLVEMTRPIDAPLPAAPMPGGLEVRPARPEQYRTIWDAREEAYRDHWGYTPATEADYQHWLVRQTFTPHLWKVAWDGDQVAGMVLNRLHEAENVKYGRKRGYTQNIFVRRPWRRRGLASALLAQSIEMFRDLGMEETALGVDTQNLSGAFRLYERMGYREQKRHTTYHKALPSAQP